MNNFIYFWKYNVDINMRWECVYYKTTDSLTDILITYGKNDYKNNWLTKIINKSSEIEFKEYIKILSRNGIRIEKLIKWFFDEYLVKEFNIENYKVNIPTKNSSYLEKCRLILPEIENCLKQYNCYLENDFSINQELINISSDMVNFEKVKSILKNKYVYNNEEKFMRYLFSSQEGLNYIERIGEGYESFIDIIKKEKIYLNDFFKEDQEKIMKLIEIECIRLKDDEQLLINNYLRVNILNDIYEKEVINYWMLGKKAREEIDKLVDKGILKFETSLLSKPESDYLNYYLNNRKFDNSLGLRNKYLHGTQDDNNEKNYYTFLRIFILLIIKINNELCLYFDVYLKELENNKQK